MTTQYRPEPQRSAVKILPTLTPRPSEYPGGFGRDQTLDRRALAKKTRASKPKVRTGCKTCKVRRVKCDEARPTCERCRKARIACDGYDTRPAPGDTVAMKGKPKAKPAGNAPAPPAAMAARRVLLPHPCPGTNPTPGSFSAHEVTYFDFFRHELINDLSGYSCSDFWSRIVLCEAMSRGCARHAVLAVAALSRGISSSLASASTANMPSALFPWTAKSIVNTEHQIAVRHYVQALSMFRKEVDVAIETPSPRAVFIMTILLLTFELLQGNMEMVDSLMTKSASLLKEPLRQYLPDGSAAPPHVAQGPGEEDVDDIECMLSFLSLMGGWTPFLKAQRTNLAIWDASIHQVPDLGHRSARQLQAEWSSFFARIMAFAGQALVKLSQERPNSPDVALSRQQQTYLCHVEKWRHVLDINLARATTAGDNRAKRAIQLMQLHHLMIDINLRCCLDPTDMAWDAYDDEFSVLVERCLAFAIETKPAYHARFTLSMGVLSTIGPAIAKCRNHDIRMRALEIARRMPWREGAWDAAAEMFGRLGAVLLEERGRDTTGFISAENRWTWVDGDWDMEQRKLVGQYVRSLPDRDGNPVVTWLELGLNEWPDVCRDISCFIDHSAGCRALETAP
ncbi:hypothetical protein LZ31DRAFT_549128 [Colletotrichum somersetense]|nr:hypothetical protein LZ31DRAFT_549128 [Colletotrichum somersetense]